MGSDFERKVVERHCCSSLEAHLSDLSLMRHPHEVSSSAHLLQGLQCVFVGLPSPSYVGE